MYKGKEKWTMIDKRKLSKISSNNFYLWLTDETATNIERRAAYCSAMVVQSRQG